MEYKRNGVFRFLCLVNVIGFSLALTIYFSASALSSYSEDALAGYFATATQYNMFTFGDANNTGNNTGDIEGRAAIGGNAGFTGFSIGDKITYTDESDAENNPILTVGGNLALSNLTVHGEIYVHSGAAVQLTSVGRQDNRSGGNYPSATYLTMNMLPIDFASMKTALINYSNALFNAQYNANEKGNCTIAYGTMTLTGTNSSFNVFTVEASVLSSLNNIQVNVPSSSTVLINVSGIAGNSVSFSNFGISTGSLSSSHILWNFPNTTSISSSSFTMVGSVLAPKATWTGQNGNFEGSMIADKVYFAGSFEGHNHLFCGTIPHHESSSSSSSSSAPSSQSSSSQSSSSSSQSSSSQSSSSSSQSSSSQSSSSSSQSSSSQSSSSSSQSSSSQSSSSSSQSSSSQSSSSSSQSSSSQSSSSSSQSSSSQSSSSSSISSSSSVTSISSESNTTISDESTPLGGISSSTSSTPSTGDHFNMWYYAFISFIVFNISFILLIHMKKHEKASVKKQ